MAFLIDDLIRFQRSLRPRRYPECFVCRKPVRDDQPSMRVRGSVVHRDCAGYRMRNPASAAERLGYPR